MVAQPSLRRVTDFFNRSGKTDRALAWGSRQIGVLISMEAPTKPMLKEAAEAGFYKPPGLEDRYPRIQILTIEELLAGKRVEYPRLLEVTFKKAPKARPAAEKKGQLQFEPVDDDEGPF